MLIQPENFARHFASSPGFDEVYTQAMSLVDEASSYLEGEGRMTARSLSRDLSMVYAGESMRLTTRLMQIAAWLMIQRSVRNGEISLSESLDDKYRLGMTMASDADVETISRLPLRFRSLVESSMKLSRRVSVIDHHLRDDYSDMSDTYSPVQEEIASIQRAFTVSDSVAAK